MIMYVQLCSQLSVDSSHFRYRAMLQQLHPSLDLSNRPHGMCCPQYPACAVVQPVERELKVLLQGNDAAQSLFQQLQDQCQGLGKLHPLHVRIMDTHMPLVNSCRRMGDIQNAVRNLTQLISAMEFHHTSPFLETMNLYQHLAQLYIDLATSAQPNKKLVARAQKLARETHRKYVGLRKICLGQDVAASDAVFMHDLDKATVLR